MNPRGGCQCKLAGLNLTELLDGAVALASQSDGTLKTHAYPEDCAIVDVAARSLLLTTDLTPLVGIDLQAAGRIAALHAMSDIYASGGMPKWALVTLVVDMEQPEDHPLVVLAGIMAQCASEGTEVVGGHTITGPEAMAGLTVIGYPSSDHVLRKKGAQPGDVLLLSKALGVGLISRGYKLGLLDEKALDAAVSTMLISNASASAAAVEIGVHAATDVTGFGMLGHLSEMLEPELGAILEHSRIPVLPEAKGLPIQAIRTIWIDNNYEYAAAHSEILGITEQEQVSVLFDPQTNGGLLVSATEEAAVKLQARGFTMIGRVTDTPTLVIDE
jgi:selenide,water dikinase